MKQILWLLSKMREHSSLFVISIIGSILEAFGTSFMTYLVKKVVDDVFILKVMSKLLMVVYLFLISAVVIQIGYFMRNFFTNLLGEKVLFKLREESFSKFLSIKPDFFVNNETGDLLSRFSNDIGAIKNIIIDYMLSLVKEPLTVILLFGVLIYRDFYLTLILIFSFPIIAYSVHFFGKKRGKYVKLNQERLGKILQQLNQIINGIESIKLFNSESFFKEKFKEMNNNLYKASVKTVYYFVTNSIFNQSIGYLVFALVLLYGGYRIVKGYTTPGDFLSYITALLLIQMPLMETQKGFMNMKSSIPILERIMFILSLEDEELGSVKANNLRSDIKFENVFVRYKDKVILNDINLLVKNKEKIGIVGPTGSGKSTLLEIIPKFVNYEGNVFIGDKELRELENKSLREKIGFVSQNVFLFNDTIRNNLLIAKPNATDSELKEAIDLSCSELVYELENGLDTFIGEGGFTLSGGERQRLAIARLFLKNPEIVLLDEITASLDNHTEKRVIKNIYDKFKDRTIFIVAHRLSNIIDCDKIIYIENGTIKEIGNFYELLEKKGLFYDLYKKYV